MIYGGKGWTMQIRKISIVAPFGGWNGETLTGRGEVDLHHDCGHSHYRFIHIFIEENPKIDRNDTVPEATARRARCRSTLRARRERNEV